MKICFPVQKNEGIESAVYNHFGSAPMFMIVDAETNSITPVNNQDHHPSPGAYNPMQALDNQKIGAIIVDGIGTNALAGLNRMGIRVYRQQGITIQENMMLFRNRNLPELTPQQCCGEQGQN